MNIDALKKKLEEYYATATPEQVVKEFESMGVEFAVIPEMLQIQLVTNYEGAIVFNSQAQEMLSEFLVHSPQIDTSNPSEIPLDTWEAAPLFSDSQTFSEEVINLDNEAGQYQYAMAA